MPKFERHRLVISNESCGTKYIALVDEPAHSERFIAFSSSSKEKYFFYDEEKYELTGPIAIPNRNIFRSSKNGTPFYVFFEEGDIVMQRDKFAKDGNNNNINIMHSDNIVDATLVESWIIADNKQDRATSLGFDLPNGTWMGTVKIHDKDFWLKKIKSGEVCGFSLQGDFGHIPVGFVEFKKQYINSNLDNMSNQKRSPWDEVYDRLASLVGAKENKNPKIQKVVMRRDDRFVTGASGPLKGKTIRMVTDSRGYAFQQDVEGETVPIPDAKYDGMDGVAIDVAEGVATQVKAGDDSGDEMMGGDTGDDVTGDSKSDGSDKKENMQGESTHELVGDYSDYLLQVMGDGSVSLIDGDGNISDAPDGVYETREGLILTIANGKVATSEKETAAEMGKDVNMRKIAFEFRKHKMDIRKMNAARDVKIDSFIKQQTEINKKLQTMMVNMASMLEIENDGNATAGTTPTDVRKPYVVIRNENHRKQDAYQVEPASQDFLEEWKSERSKNTNKRK